MLPEKTLKKVYFASYIASKSILYISFNYFRHLRHIIIKISVNIHFKPRTACIKLIITKMIGFLVPFDCPVKFERMGCYKDSTRPLSDYILTDRDIYHPKFSGISIDWLNYDTHLPDFSCRCAQKAVEEGFNTFGIQYYGRNFDFMYFVYL